MKGSPLRVVSNGVSGVNNLMTDLPNDLLNLLVGLPLRQGLWLVMVTLGCWSMIGLVKIDNIKSTAQGSSIGCKTICSISARC